MGRSFGQGLSTPLVWGSTNDDNRPSWPSYVMLACRPGTCFSSTPLSCGRQRGVRCPCLASWASQPGSATSWRPSIQRSSLRTIFPDLSYRQALLHTRLPTLHDRRVNLCRTCAASSLANADLAHWFPSRRSDCHTYNLRNNHQRGLPRMTKRLENSPVNYIINNSMNEPMA